MRWLLVGTLVAACAAGCGRDTVPDEALVLDLDRPRPPPPDAGTKGFSPAQIAQITVERLEPGDRSPLPTLWVRLSERPDYPVLVQSVCETQGYLAEDAAIIVWQSASPEALLERGPDAGRCEVTFSSFGDVRATVCLDATLTLGPCSWHAAAGAPAGSESAAVTGARFYVDRTQRPPHLIVQALSVGDPNAATAMIAESVCRRDGFEIVAHHDGSAEPEPGERDYRFRRGAQLLHRDVGPVADCEVHFRHHDRAVSPSFCYDAARGVQRPCTPSSPPPPPGASLRIDELAGDRERARYTFLATVGATLPAEAHLRAFIECPGKTPVVAEIGGLALPRLRPGQSTPMVVDHHGVDDQDEACALRVLLGQRYQPLDRWCGAETGWRRCR